MADSQQPPEMPAEQRDSREISPDVPPEQIISRQESPDLPPGDIERRQESPDLPPGDIERRQESPDLPPGDIERRQESPGVPPGDIESRQGTRDVSPGNIDSRQGTSDVPPGNIDSRQGTRDASPEEMECRQRSPDVPPEEIVIDGRQGAQPSVIDNNGRSQVRWLRSELDLATSLYRVSEGRCANYRREIQELKDQLAMFRSAAQLGVFTVQPPTDITARDEPTGATARDEPTCAIAGDEPTGATARDEPTGATARDEATAAESSAEGRPTSDELVASMRADLERCLNSNRQRSAEVLEKLEEIRILREDLTITRALADRMNHLCTELQTAVNIMARHQVQFENMHRQVLEVAEENECYKIALQKVQEAKSRQDDVVASLIAHISGMHEKYELEKRFALEMFKQAMEERQKESVDKQMQDLDSAKSEMNNLKYLFSKVCVESTVKDAQMKTFFAELLEKLRKVQEIKVDSVVEQWQVMQAMLEDIMNDVHQMCQRDSERRGSSQEVEQLADELFASTSAAPKDNNELDTLD